MAEPVEELEARLAKLCARLREANRARDEAAAAPVRAEMRIMEATWEAALAAESAEATRPAAGAAPRPAEGVPPRPPQGVPLRSGLLAVCSWPLERRIIAPLSPRTTSSRMPSQRPSTCSASPPPAPLLTRHGDCCAASPATSPAPTRAANLTLARSSTPRTRQPTTPSAGRQRPEPVPDRIEQVFGVASLHIVRDVSTS